MTLRAVVLSSLVLVTWLPEIALAQGAVSSLRKLLESGRVPAERQGQIIEMICTRGEADDLAVIFQMLVKPGGLAPETRRKVLELMADAAMTRKVVPAGDLSPLAALLDGDAAATDRRAQIAAIRLAAAWRLKSVAPALSKMATDDGATDSQREAALETLSAIGGADSRQTIETLAASSRSTRIRILAAAALSRLDTKAGAQAAAVILTSIEPRDDIGPMLDALLSRKDGADQLASALAGKTLKPDAAKLALRYIFSVGRSDPALADVLSKAAGIALDSPPPSQEDVAKIAAQVSAKGDAARGEKIFRRADLSCLKCHSVAQAGGTVGPDLSAVGTISPVDYIVNSILNPSLAIKEQFVTRRVLTTDGEIFTGIQIDRDDQRLRLRDAAGKEITIPVANIDQEGEGLSLMPQGLTKFLTHEELLDLAKFISELGKPGPYAIRKTPTIQRWRVLKNPSPELIADAPNVEILREHVLDTTADAWSTSYGMVGGTLPLAELATAGPTVLFVQGQIDVIQAGPIALEITCTEPVQAWLDAEPFDSAKHIERPLATGRHTLTLRIQLSQRPAAELKVEWTKPAGSGAQFVVVNGM